MNQTVDIYRPSNPEEQLRQCEIMSNLVHLVPRTDNPETTDQITIRYILLLSQDCDLNQDFNNRKENKNKLTEQLPYLIFVELYPFEEIRLIFDINDSVDLLYSTTSL